jgi:predicted MFS family arabinose efflux permease
MPVQTSRSAVVALLALAAGVTVADLYYCQPVLGTIAQSFGAASDAVSMVVTLTQFGYAAGLLLVVPLGDIFERRRLIVVTAAGSALALVAVAFSPNLSFLLGSSFLLGAIGVTPQIVVPYAAGIVPPENRGRVVGTVMSGLLIGILLSRTLSGFLNTVVGWRAIYLISAAVVLALSILLALVLPKQLPEHQSRMHYGHLLSSLLILEKSEPVLRRHALVGAALTSRCAG